MAKSDIFDRALFYKFFCFASVGGFLRLQMKECDQ